MRDWISVGRQQLALPQQPDQSPPAALALDTDHGTVYTVTHSPPTSSGLAAFRIYGTIYHKGCLADTEPKLVLKVDLVAFAQDDTANHSQVRSFTYMADGGSATNDEPALCLITSGGDIVLVPLAQGLKSTPQPEIVGSVEQGILAAAWSPDEESVVLVVPPTDDATHQPGAEKMLIMSREFEVLDEKIIQEQGRGEEQVSVGWGSKVTQFHGSAGKQAALAAATKTQDPTLSRKVKPLQDDDGLPHISWRGDCAFFVVSSLEILQSDAGTRRIVRTFDRSGALTAVSDENETGLTHTVAMKPTGNIYATSQRFRPEATPSSDSSAHGRENRHDIIFFERNGLKRGSFQLREDEGALVDGSEGGPTEVPLLDAASKQREMVSTWSHSHKIIDMKWSPDGNALGVWLSRQSQDVLQIWTMSNWHWYLKQEINPPLTSHGSRSRIGSWVWHPQETHQLFVSYAGCDGSGIEVHSFHEQTVAETLTRPTASSGVSVSDGAVQRVTFLDKQTIPPPMCSLVLPTSKTAVWRSTLSDTIVPNDTQGSLGGWTPRHKAWSGLEVERNGQKVAVSVLALLHPAGKSVQLWTFTFASPKAAAVTSFAGTVDIDCPQDWEARQIALVTRAASGKVQANISILGDVASSPVLCSHTVSFDVEQGASSLEAGSTEARALSRVLGGRSVLFTDESVQGDGAVLLLHESGEVRMLSSLSIPEGAEEPLAILDDFCPTIQAIRTSPESLHVLGLSAKNHLHVATFQITNGEMAASTCLTRDATSFVVSPPFLVWTNTSHEARFLPLSNLQDVKSAGSSTEVVSLDRRVERGSRIVTAAPRQMALVLQMPRGNLERIFPRGMVLDRVRTDLDRGRYKAALLHCRSNRVDLNLLFDHNPQAFLRDVKQFIDKVNDVDHFNLFLSSLRSEDVTTTMYKPLTGRTAASFDVSTKVNLVCDAFIRELTVLNDPKRYINSILTAHVKKVPADYESALSTLRDMMSTSPELVDSAIEYVIFLAPFDSLFDVALGMYDLTLALMVAQHSKKKDPREYLPFLRELKTIQPMELQRFEIDDHLRRHGKAVKWLATAGEEHHERALQYMTKYRLFGEGLEVFSRVTKKWKQVQFIYGEYLLERQKWTDAALAFQLAGDVDSALKALHEAGAWQDAFSLALSERKSAGEIKALATSMASRLEETSRHAEAGRVKLEYERNVEGALESYGKANDITECRRICSAVGRLDLLETHVKPAALSTQESLVEDIKEMTDQLEKQLSRMKELREKKESEPSAFYGENDPALDKIEIQSDTSTQITQFTRYTKAPSHVGTMSSISATSKGTTKRGDKRLKKKEEKKKAAGKKGSVYEEDYLYESVQKLLLERLGNIQDEVSKLLSNLIILGPNHRQAAMTLQDSLSTFESKAITASSSLEEISIQAGIQADEARITALSQSNALNNPTTGLLHLLAGTTWLDKAAQRKKVEVAQRKWKSEMLETTMKLGH
ncbi:unnamed protein product [Sympodiomycopsis kandeliae]